MLLIEKAFAKRVGSYSNLIGGCEPVAWVALTGCEEQQAWKRVAGGWNKNKWTEECFAGCVNIGGMVRA